MTYKELLEKLEAALVPEDAVGVVLALLTEAYESGFKAGAGRWFWPRDAWHLELLLRAQAQEEDKETK